MTTSGTYAFNPAFGELVALAYGRIGQRRTALTVEQFDDARKEGNFLLSEWSNKQVNLWTIELQTQVLTPDQATYTLDPKVVAVRIAYISTESSGSTIDRVLSPISRDDYASLPNKEQSGFPTIYWFDRLITPTITLWQPPDDSQTYTLKWYQSRQIQDVGYVDAQTVEIPYRFQDAYVSGLAARLARIHAPERYGEAMAEAQRAWDIAAAQDQEEVPMYITPGMAGYYR